MLSLSRERERRRNVAFYNEREKINGPSNDCIVELRYTEHKRLLNLIVAQLCAALFYGAHVSVSATATKKVRNI